MESNQKDKFAEYTTHCAICKEKESTKLCDFPFNYEFDPNESKIFYSTCSLPMCDDCAKTEMPIVFGDFCPHHWQLWQQRHLKGDQLFRSHLKRQQLQNRLNICKGCGTHQGCDPEDFTKDWICERCENDART